MNGCITQSQYRQRDHSFLMQSHGVSVREHLIATLRRFYPTVFYVEQHIERQPVKQLQLEARLLSASSHHPAAWCTEP